MQRASRPHPQQIHGSTIDSLFHGEQCSAYHVKLPCLTTALWPNRLCVHIIRRAGAETDNKTEGKCRFTQLTPSRPGFSE